MEHSSLSFMEFILVIAALSPLAIIIYLRGAVGEIREIRKHLSGGDNG